VYGRDGTCVGFVVDGFGSRDGDGGRHSGGNRVMEGGEETRREQKESISRTEKKVTHREIEKERDKTRNRKSKRDATRRKTKGKGRKEGRITNIFQSA